MSRWLIYALVDPLSKEWRYIGKSSYGLARPRSHVGYARRGQKSHKANWIRALMSVGLRYDIEVLETFTSDEALSVAEKEWIAAARMAGVRLTNLTDGGEGVCNPCPETRAKMGTGWKGKKLLPHVVDGLSKAAKERVGSRNPFFGRKHSEASKRTMSQLAAQRSINPFAGKRHTPEALEKMRGRVWSDEARARVKGRQMSAETREKMSASAKARRRREALSAE